ncbi:putative transcriptional regulator [Pedobacter sp. UYP1]|jgi:putative transcriptional regulator
MSAKADNFIDFYHYKFNNNLLMPIVINLDVMLAKRKVSLTELSLKVGITLSNLSILKTGKAKAIRLETLEAICKALDCQPGDILEYSPMPV